MKATFSTEDADYIKIHGHSDDEAFAYWDYGVELSRRFRALKVWLTLRYYGVRRIAEAVSNDIALAAYMGELVFAAEDFELLAGGVEHLLLPLHSRRVENVGSQELDQLNEAHYESRTKRRPRVFVKRNGERQVCIAGLHH